MHPRRAAAIIAGIVLAIGVIVGFWPHSIPLDYRAEAGVDTVSCGSAFAPDGSGAEDASLGRHIRGAFSGELSASAAEYEAQCSDAVTTPRVLGLVLVGLGLVGGLFLGLTMKSAAAERLSAQGPDPV